MAVSIVIPCYRSERSIELLVDKLATLPLTIEVILVDDESPDGTWEAIRRCCQKHDFVTGYSLARNVGQHNALLVGIRKARYSTIVTMDDDLQYDPADIPKMVSALDEGADLVYGVPMQDRQSWLRRLTSRASKYVFERALNMPNTENSSSFRAFSENGQKALRAFKGGLVDIDAILSWGVRHVVYLTVPHYQRAYGRSNYTYWRLFEHALKMVVAYSEIPLLFSFFLGLGVLGLSIAMIVYFLSVALLYGTSVPGFTMLLCTVLFFAGAQIVMIGILSRYVGSIHTQVKGKPIAVIRSSVAGKGGAKNGLRRAGGKHGAAL